VNGEVNDENNILQALESSNADLKRDLAMKAAHAEEQHKRVHELQVSIDKASSASKEELLVTTALFEVRLHTIYNMCGCYLAADSPLLFCNVCSLAAMFNGTCCAVVCTPDPHIPHPRLRTGGWVWAVRLQSWLEARYARAWIQPLLCH
jgi:hypothetical protein